VGAGQESLSGASYCRWARRAIRYCAAKLAGKAKAHFKYGVSIVVVIEANHVSTASKPFALFASSSSTASPYVLSSYDKPEEKSSENQEVK